MAPKENPSDRTRAGIARDRADNTPGPTMASDATMPALPTNAQTTSGASANSAANPEAARAETPISVNTSPWRRAARRAATVAPMATPARANSCTGAMTRPRWRTPRWNVCWYWSEASEAKPINEAARNGRARKMRRSTPIVHTSRHASPNEGGRSAPESAHPGPGPWSAAASPVAAGASRVGSPTANASSSWRPRVGSCKVSPMATSTRIGTASTKKGARHPNTRANPAPPSNPTMVPADTPPNSTENTLGRTGTG